MGLPGFITTLPCYSKGLVGPQGTCKVNKLLPEKESLTRFTHVQNTLPARELRGANSTHFKINCSSANASNVPRREFLKLGAAAACGLVTEWGFQNLAPASAVEERTETSTLTLPGADSVSSVYDLSVYKDGKPRSLKDYSGKVTLFVNVASYCALTPQYKGLVKLHDLYQNQGFEIVAAPCNQFARQEPESDADICSRVKNTFGVKFLLVDKLVVNDSKKGEDGPIAPLYTYLRNHAPEKKGAPISWNFEKFLVSRDGQVLRRYSPGIYPDDLEDDVQFAIDHADKPLPPRPKGYLGV